jgi:hypothetical protein
VARTKRIPAVRSPRRDIERWRAAYHMPDEEGGTGICLASVALVGAPYRHCYHARRRGHAPRAAKLRLVREWANAVRSAWQRHRRSSAWLLARVAYHHDALLQELHRAVSNISTMLGLSLPGAVVKRDGSGGSSTTCVDHACVYTDANGTMYVLWYESQRIARGPSATPDATQTAATAAAAGDDVSAGPWRSAMVHHLAAAYVAADLGLAGAPQLRRFAIVPRWALTLGYHYDRIPRLFA